MNQSELIEKVAQATALNQAAAGHAVKAVVNAILDSLVAGEAVRVSGLGTFNVTARPAREGRNPGRPARGLHRERNLRCGNKALCRGTGTHSSPPFCWQHAPGESRFHMGGQAEVIALDGEIVVPDDRGAHIDDLQDVIAGLNTTPPGPMH